MNTDSLLQSVETLFALLADKQIDYLLVGGIALLQYVEGRNTQDIDLIMALSSLHKLPEIQITSQDTNFVRGEFNDLQIDLLLTQNPLFAEVQQNYATTHIYREQLIPTATVEGLLLLKLYALPSLYRQGNFARVGIYENDVSTLLHYYKPEINVLLRELSNHLNDHDMDEIRNILAEIHKRLERFQGGSPE